MNSVLKAIARRIPQIDRLLIQRDDLVSASRRSRSVQDGESPEVVASVIGINRSTIYGWLAQYRRGGWGALKAKPLFGRPPKLMARS
jgi:hypothetical protein